MQKRGILKLLLAVWLQNTVKPDSTTWLKSTKLHFCWCS